MLMKDRGLLFTEVGRGTGKVVQVWSYRSILLSMGSKSVRINAFWKDPKTYAYHEA